MATHRLGTYEEDPMAGLMYSKTLKKYFRDNRAMFVVTPFSLHALTISRLSTYRLTRVLLLVPPVRMCTIVKGIYA